MAVRNLSFDDGLEKIKINGDPNRVIVFNPGDMNIITRYNEVVKRMNDLSYETLGTEQGDKDDIEYAGDQLQLVDKLLKEQFNYLFAADVYDTIFNGQSPLNPVGKDKRMLCEVVLTAIGDIIGDACGKNVDTINMKMKNYTEKYKPKDHLPKGAK